jgi:GNAT superfamily N-acetyltransferase
VRIRRGLRHGLVLIADRMCFPPPDETTEVEGAEWWGAWDYTRLAAYAAAVRLPKEPDVVYLRRCGVLPDYRGRGLQRQLITARVRWARRVGAREVVTDTHPNNVPSAKTLVRAGFEPYEPIVRWAGEPWSYWRLEL